MRDKIASAITVCFASLHLRAARIKWINTKVNRKKNLIKKSHLLSCFFLVCVEGVTFFRVAKSVYSRLGLKDKIPIHEEEIRKR